MKIITVGKLGAVLLALACSVIPRQAEGSHPTGTAFTYQGELKKAGLAVTDACDFEFTLWDEDALGLQMGLTESMPAVPVSVGLFTVKLDFGESVFRGQPRFLEIAVECPGDAGFTTLSPRHELTPTPYAVLAAKLALPYEDSVASGAPAFAIGNTGTGEVLRATQSGDGDALKIDQSGPTGVGMDIDVTNAANPNNVITADTAGNGNVIKATTAGTGKVLNAEINKLTSNSEVIRVRSNGNGRGIDAELTKPTSTSEVMRIKSLGKGSGIDAELANPANANAVFKGVTNGTGQVINALTTGTGGVMTAHVVNPANVAIALDVLHSGNGPGILSVLSKPTNPLPAIGGVTHGLGPAVVADIQNPANGAEALLAMTAGTGPAVLADNQGIGGNALFAHVGNPGNDASTIHAVTLGGGSAIEANIENPGSGAHALKAMTDGTGQAIDAVIANPGSIAPVIKASGDHDGIGVFAHMHKPDNTGNAIVGYTEGTEAAGMFKNFNPGPGPLQFGILAGSDGFSAAAAGVVALGNGAESPGEPRAAALRIENGAVTVSGETRPAGTLDLDSSVWFAQESCESFCPDSCFHKHQVSQYAETTLYNDYLRGDSIILLTVRTTGDGGDHRTYYAQVSWQTTGSADIRVTGVGNDPGCLTPDPGENISVHYFIINPLDDV